MAFSIYVDSGANLTSELLKNLDIKVVPFTYSIGDDVYECTETTDDDAAHKFYDMLRNKVVVKTSMINADRFMKAFRGELANGNDVFFVGISSGISGTVHSAETAAEMLEEEFPDRKIKVFDSLGAGLGFMLAMVLFAGVRGKMEDCDVPEFLKGLPITLIAASLVSLSFLGFSGIIEGMGLLG